MRRGKIVAQILLIFSIASVVLAAHAIVRQRSLITDGSNDESTDESMPSQDTASHESETSSGLGWVSESPAWSEHDSVPGSQSGSLHQDGMEPAASPPPANHDIYVAPVSVPPQLHDNLQSGLGAAPLHNDPPSGPGDAHPSLKNWHPVMGVEQEASPRLQPEALEASRVSESSFGSGWAELLAAIAEDEAKEAEDKVKPPKGLCGLRCWMQFPRSVEWSPERDHGHRFSWGVCFCSLPPVLLPASKPAHNLTYDLFQSNNL